MMQVKTNDKNDWSELISIVDDQLVIEFGKSKICLGQQGDICFSNQQITLQLNQQGQFELEAENIQQTASQHIMINGGRSIQLNSQ